MQWKWNKVMIAASTAAMDDAKHNSVNKASSVVHGIALIEMVRCFLPTGFLSQDHSV